MSRPALPALLAAMYFCYFAAIGIWMPYWPLYLAVLGFDAMDIGLLMSASLLVKIIAPPFWGQMADRFERRRITRIATLTTLLSFLPLLVVRDFTTLMAVTILYNFCNTGPMALTETITMDLVMRAGGNYGRIRRWGSFGFILTALGLGWPMDRWGVELLVPVLGAVLLVGVVLSLALPVNPNPAPPARTTEHDSIFSHPQAASFFVAAVAMQFSHSAYYGFMSLHLEGNGFSRTAIGMLWTLGVIAEIVLMGWSKPMMERFGAARTIRFSLLMAVLRWSIYATPPMWLSLLVGQLLHGFTFGSFHIASLHHAYTMAPEHRRATAQAWYAAMSFGLGGGTGAAVAGYLFDAFGADTLFTVMAVVAGVGVLAARRLAPVAVAGVAYPPPPR